MMLNLINPNSAYKYVLLVILITILSVVFTNLSFLLNSLLSSVVLQGKLIVMKIKYYQKLTQNHKRI